ncbi:type VI secretion system protein TssL, short form [Klebsiella aerogenes]
MTQDINIDALLADSWLTVTELRLGAKLAEGEGKLLWQRCVDNIEQVMAQLVAADVSETNRQHILYAWCALLDETAKGRKEEDDACIAWYDRPLEVKYFGGMEAGDALYERIRQTLREPAPDIAVLTCFHRVLSLGFKGRYSLNDPARAALVSALGERVPPFACDPHLPILASLSGRRGMADWLRRWPVCLGLSLAAVAALWLGLNYWLDALVAALRLGGGQ